MLRIGPTLTVSYPLSVLMAIFQVDLQGQIIAECLHFVGAKGDGGGEW